MEKFKGTPGPWRYIHQTHATKPSGLGQRYAVIAQVIDFLHRPEERWLFNVKLDKTQDLNLHREAEANARLIAASPDLLEVVDLFLKANDCEDEGHFFHKMQENDLYNKAKSAFNKAIVHE